jgi:hypothetical protein
MLGGVQRYDEILHPVIYEDEVITVYGELQSFGLQLHAYVHKWTPKTKEHIRNVLALICVDSPYPVFALATNPKLKKFCEIMGFVSLDDVHNREGELLGELMFVPNSGQENDYV